jgi:hypothetical protein
VAVGVPTKCALLTANAVVAMSPNTAKATRNFEKSDTPLSLRT